jgi:hypothetical protein
MSDLIKATGLWRKTSSKTGKEYFTGRWGALRVLVFENRDRKGDNEPSYFLMLGVAEDKRDQPAQEVLPPPKRGQSTSDRSRDHDLPTGRTAEHRNSREDPRQQRIDELASRFEPDEEIPF